MAEDVQSIVRAAVIKMIEDTASERKIVKSQAIHNNKIHFVPARYRVLGGLLQSLNIQFGNFIEKLIAIVIDQDDNITALAESGKKVPLSMTQQTDALIDAYITQRQLPDSPDQCDEDFKSLLDSIYLLEQNPDIPKQTIVKDIDGLFRLRSGTIIYLEIKYNDDHDTGKFVDINRKFLKTYAGLVSLYKTNDVYQIRPILYYFNPVKRWGPIYIPSTNIYRGKQLFDEFFTTPFADIDAYLRSLGDDEQVMAIFDQLYQRIRYGK